jgi:hypothetical protein
MPAIVTDQLRISKAKNFVSRFSLENLENESYYIFVGLPNSSEYDPEWNDSPPAPKDSFDDENDYWDTMIALKRIKDGDVKQCIRKITWESGVTFDMYRHDISRNNRSTSTLSTSLYSSNFYVLNSEYRVYICLNNGLSPENPNGRPSLDEPIFTDLEPRSAGDSGDGYIWKYLFTVNPTDIIRFDSTNFIPVPRNWGSDPQTSLIKNNAITSGQLKTIIVNDRGRNLGPRNRIYTNVPIKGDGIDATAIILIDNDSKVQSVTVSNGGSGYTYGTVDIMNSGIPIASNTLLPSFDVIIPPKGGHGYDIDRELGSYYAMIYSKIENDTENPDFIVGNEISRIGIVQNPEQYGSNSLLTEEKASALNALKLVGISNIDDFKNARFTPDSLITQTIGVGITAVGKVISYDSNTGVLKYWRDRTLHGFNADGSKNLSPTYGFKLNDFTSNPESGGSLTIMGGSIDLKIDTNYGSMVNPGITTVINNRTYQLGQYFVNGVSNPEVKKNSGNIIYVDNRPSITRSQNQRENIKIVLQF